MIFRTQFYGPWKGILEGIGFCGSPSPQAVRAPLQKGMLVLLLHCQCSAGGEGKRVVFWGQVGLQTLLFP